MIQLYHYLDHLTDTSFAWHMAEHVVLLFIVPLLILLARPFALFRAVAGKELTARTVRATRPLHAITNPVACLSITIGYLWIMHFSPLYEAALENPWVHLGEHGLLVAVGLLFWIPVIAPPPLRPIAFPARLLYLFLALPQGALLALAIGSARAPLYAHYAALMPPAVALADQANGAAVMWIAGGFIVFVAFLSTFAAWAAREAYA